MNWFFAQGKQPHGPVTEAEFEALVASGTVTENTLVWKSGMADWAPLREVRASSAAAATPPPEGWVRCTATGRYFPPEEIVYLEGKPYSATAKSEVLRGLMNTGSLPVGLARDGPAWERGNLGFFESLWETVGSVLFAPRQCFRTMKREGGFGKSLGFNVLLVTTASIVSTAYKLLHLTFRDLASPQVRELVHLRPTLSPAALALGIALQPFVLVLGSFFTAGLLHFFLKVFEGARQPYETTFRACCYVSGSAAMWRFVPVLGTTADLIWWLVVMCIALAESHEIPIGRAVPAVLVPMGVCLGIVYGTHPGYFLG